MMYLFIESGLVYCLLWVRNMSYLVHWVTEVHIIAGPIPLILFPIAFGKRIWGNGHHHESDSGTRSPSSPS